MSKIAKAKIDKYSLADLARCADTYLLLHNCPGGRPIVNGYVCPHCGTDTSEGDCGGVKDFKRRER